MSDQVQEERFWVVEDAKWNEILVRDRARIRHQVAKFSRFYDPALPWAEAYAAMLNEEHRKRLVPTRVERVHTDDHGHQWISVKELLRRTGHGVSPSVIYKMASEGTIEAFRISERKWLVRSDALDLLHVNQQVRISEDRPQKD